MKKCCVMLGIILLISLQYVFSQEDNSSVMMESNLRQEGIIQRNEIKTDYQNYLKEIDPATKTPTLDSDGNPRTYSWYKLDSFKLVNVGPGIQAISVNLASGKWNLIDSITPVNVTFNLVQRKIIHWYQDNTGDWEKEVFFISLWSPSIGLLFNKTEINGSDAWTGGVSIIPLQIRIEDFSIGIGFDWRSTDTVEFKPENFNIDLPISYQFGF